MAILFEPFRTDRTIQLANEEYVRTFSIGTNWQKIRIGIRFCFPSTGNCANTEFYFGVCQGTTNTFLSSNTTDWMGITVGTPYGNAVWNYNVGRYFSPGGGNYAPLKRVGNTNTVITSLGGSPAITANPAVHNTMFLDVLKGSPNYVLTFWMCNAAQSAVDISRPLWAYYMPYETSTPNVSGSGALNVAYSGSGLFDTLSIRWNKIVPVMFIYDVGVCRFY